MLRGAAATAKSRTSEVENIILKLCDESPNGITQKTIQEAEPDLPLMEIMASINSLTRQHRLEMLSDNLGVLVLRAVSAVEATKKKGLSAEELMVFQHIEKSGNMGLWTKDMKTRTNLQQPQITKIIKQLESRKLIKAVKSVASANRKVYMAYDVEPAREITGGAWYTDHMLDDEFVASLRKACLAYIRKHDECTLLDIATEIRNRKLVTADTKLRDEDYGMILDTLCLDGKVERLPGMPHDRFSLPAMVPMESTSLTSMPCGVCPVAGDCTPDGPISPATCVYYQSWLY